MKRHLIANILTMALLALVFLGFLLYAVPVREAVGDALQLVSGLLIPSLFPAMVLSSLFIESGPVQRFGRRLDGVMRFLFDLPGEAAVPLLLALAAGYPIGAKSTVSLFESGALTSDQAERLLAFSNTSGLAFLLGTAGLSLFSSFEVGLLFLCTHFLAAIAVGLVLRFYPHPPSHRSAAAPPPFVSPSPPFSSAFPAAVCSSALSLLSVAAFVVFFSALNCVLAESGLLFSVASALSSLTGISLPCAEGLLIGLTEMTGGLSNIASAPVSLPDKLVPASFLLGWAGLSVHFQAVSFVRDNRLSCSLYFIGKLLHGLFSALFVYLFIRIFPLSRPVSLSAAFLSPRLPVLSALCFLPIAGFVWLLFRRSEKKP